MEFGEMLISTGVDALIKLVREKGRVEITLASRLLNIPISTIEEWSHALEEEGIISVEYQLTKVYLKWVSPTEEQVEKERAVLEGEKTQLVQEINEREATAEGQSKQVSMLKDEFAANYSKIMERVEELGKKTAGDEHLKGVREEDYYKAVDALSEVRGKITELGDSVKFMREQLEKTRTELMGSDMEKKMKGVMESRASVSTLKKELDAMEKEVSKSLEALSAEDIDVSNLKGPMEEIRRDYATLKMGMDRERESLKEAESAAQLLANAKEVINSLRGSTEAALGEMKGATGSASEIEEKISRLSAVLKENGRKAEQFREALKNTEETLEHFKMDEKAHARIEKLVEQGKELEAKMEKFQHSVEQAFPLFENIDNLISSLSELRKKIQEERKRLAEESGAIFASLDEEIATYSTFQKIKEKAARTISDYMGQLEKIEVNYEKVEKDAEKLGQKLDETLQKFRESGEFKGMDQLSTAMDALLEKKRALEEIRRGIESLDSSATKTLKHVKLLAKEAELLELRSGSSVPGEREQARRAGEEIRESISLTESEQRDFDGKREELRKLIKKLWEEE